MRPAGATTYPPSHRYCTGVSRFSELGYYYQVQALATPANLSDPDLVRWVKRPLPVMVDAPPGGTNAQWRDPTTAWVASDEQLGPDTYWAAVGAQQQCVGGAALYASADFHDWQYRGQLFSQTSLGEGTCVPSANASACDQFSGCPMNECPDFFTLDGNVTVIKYSDQVLHVTNAARAAPPTIFQVRGRKPFGQDWYIVSDEPLNYTNPDGAFVDSWRGHRSTPQLFDWGSVYASKTFATRNGRRIWWGWAYETAVGCTEMCSQGTPLTDAMVRDNVIVYAVVSLFKQRIPVAMDTLYLQGWQGMQTLPREVTLDPEAGTLLLRPVKEVAALRRGVLHASQCAVAPGQQVPVVTCQCGMWDKPMHVVCTVDGAARGQP